MQSNIRDIQALPSHAHKGFQLLVPTSVEWALETAQTPGGYQGGS